ncbi:lipopolysaccharide assembly protein LapB, partial [Terrabacter sp. Soil810]|uniref:tetratricopeptide repeat protein n=1 Tax=Terrabacter sp. Soil810 TaxID=1736418 RepID=UPI001F3AE6C4
GGYRSDDRRSSGSSDRGGYRSDDRRSSGGSDRSGYRSDDRARGGAGRPQDDDRRGGPRLTPKAPRKPEPAIREGVTGHEVDRGVKNQLRTLSKENAEGVAQHLVMVAELLDVEPEAALAHAETAVRRAGRVPAARESLGLVAYRLGDWARALGEFRTVRRLSGSSHLLPLMVDCERALGRHDKALELAQSDEAGNLAIDDRVELAIVVSGIRRDLGQLDAAVAGLSDLVKRINPNRPSAARLFYAYADAKLAAGDLEVARDWFARAADADHELATDAAERLEELDGVDVTDLLGDEDEDGYPIESFDDDA